MEDHEFTAHMSVTDTIMIIMIEFLLYTHVVIKRPGKGSYKECSLAKQLYLLKQLVL